MLSENISKDLTSTIAKTMDVLCSEDDAVKLEGIILTGSMASYMKDPDSHSHPRWDSIPDINLYAFIDNGPVLQARANSYLAESIEAAKAMVDEHYGISRLKVLLDLHPSSLFIGSPDPQKTNIQLTTRTISVRDKNLIADYCWKAWASNYVTLVPEGGDLFRTISTPEPVRDHTWLRNMYLGLVSYGNQLMLSPLSDPAGRNIRCFDEGYRYMKEIAKDGVQLGLKNDESHLAPGIITRWKTDAADFYSDAYGKEAAEMVALLNETDENYWEKREEPGCGIALVESALALRDIVFDLGFRKRADELGVRSYKELVQWY